jgi:DNA-binding transcriptional LysR family regulator
MDLIDAMSAFVRVAERGGFSAAARDLHVSQPHVTRAVAQLERRLGTRLITRSTRLLSLTDEGREYLARCQNILADIEDADQAIGVRATSLTGQLRIFAPVSLGRAWFVPRIAGFMAEHPNLDVVLKLQDRRLDLVEEKIDVAIHIAPLSDSTLRQRHLTDVPLHVVGSPAYWIRHGRPTLPADLDALPALVFDGPIARDQIVMQKGAEKVHLRLNGRFRSDSSEGMLEATKQGIGWCPAPLWLVERETGAGVLEQVLPDWTIVPHMSVYAVDPQTRAPTERLRRFLDWLVESFKSRRDMSDSFTAQDKGPGFAPPCPQD